MKASEHPRVLIFESDDVLRVLLFTVLRRQPVLVDTAATGDAAIALLESCDYALIVIDLDMGAEAASFLERLTSMHAELPTRIVALADPSLGSQGPREVITAVLTKPIQIETFAALVRECAPLVPLPTDPKPCAPAESQTLRSPSGASTNR